MSNLDLWKSVERTPPEHVKKITGKSYQGNSPKPHYLVHKATETFGPCGIGWGFTIVDERVEDGAGGERVHIARVRVWFDWDGKRGEVEHVGGTAFSGTRNNGKAFTDEDAPKKSVTDALVKALSLIGFAGDIFLGRYDDSKYVASLHEEAREEPETPFDDGPNEEQRAGYIALAESVIDEASDVGALREWWGNEGHRRVVNGLNQADVNALKERVMARLETLKPKAA